MEEPGHGAAAEPQPELRFAFAVAPGAPRLLMPLGLPGEIWPEPRFAALPATEPWCSGLVNLRGTLAPAYELAGSVGLPSPPAGEEKLLILGHGEERVGVLIHGDPQPVTVLRSSAPEPPSQRLFAPFVAACFRTENGEVLWEFNLTAWVRHAQSAAAPDSLARQTADAGALEGDFA